MRYVRHEAVAAVGCLTMLALLALVVAASAAISWVWDNVHPVAGVIVGAGIVVLVLGNRLRILYGVFVPWSRFGMAGTQFIAAWEERFGEMYPGSPTMPPAGTFQAWRREHKQTGISAGEWLDRRERHGFL